MGRPYNILIGAASAVIGLALLATGTAGARPDEPASPPAASQLPADFLAPSKTPTPGNLGPEPIPYPSSAARAPKTAAPKPPGRKPDAPKPPAELADTPPVDGMPAVAALPEPPSAAPPPVLPPPVEAAASAGEIKRDDALERVQAPNLSTPVARQGAASAAAVGDGTTLPPAIEKPGLPVAAGNVPKEPETPFVVAADKLPLGKQGVGLTVEVIAPQFLNLKQTAALKIVVKNSGTSDARGVVVRDTLPPNLTFVSSQPETTPVGSLLTWNLGDVPPGADRQITLSVQPNATGAFDHAATVTMAAGARSQTLVREPKLKVEMSSNSGKVLKGQPVTFKIAIRNPGDGPARNVTVQARLSTGLREASGEPNSQNLFEQTIAVIGPGEVETLDALVADTLLGGDQTCTIAASSPDVVAGSAEARRAATVTVVEPKLTIKVAGPDKRFTDQIASYEVTMTNPGTSVARNVKVVATLPVSGRVQSPLPPGARFDRQTRKLTWSRPQLDAGESAVATFQIQMGGVGLYQVAAEAKADGVPLAKDILATNVEGLTDVNIDVSEKRHVIDVNGETIYFIKLTNTGTKEATGLLLSAVLSDNTEALDTSGTDEVAKSDTHKVLFPQIPRLGPGKAIELGIKVKVAKYGTGLSTCRVFLSHNELSEKLEDVATFKIAPPTRR